MANQQGNLTREPSTTARLGLRAESWYSLLPGESRGIKDYENVNLGTWRAATDSEYNTGHLPAGATLRQVITAGGDRTQTILTAASKREQVTVTKGTHTVSYGSDGSTIYTFPGGSYSASYLQTIDKSRYETSFDTQGATSVIRRLVSSGTAVYRPANPTKQTSISWTAPAAIKKGTSVTINLSNAGYKNLYDCTSWDTYYTAPSYDYVGYYASSGSASDGGTIKVVPSTPEKTTTQKYGYYTHIPASGEEQTKTFLVQDS